MASDGGSGGVGLSMELLERGDPAFVDALRAVHDADALAEIAGPWYEDRRPASRRLLLEYLERPLNAFRHEALIKRLFKRAEAEADDEVMARFLVLFDRSIRRARVKRHRHEQRTMATSQEAEELRRTWEDVGYTQVHSWGVSVSGFRPHEVVISPRGTTMPRGRMVDDRRWHPSGKQLVPDWAVRLKLDWMGEFDRADIRQVPSVLEKLKRFRLFSVATRKYLRRRAWRYFRYLGKGHPGRYVAAASGALALYRDEDVSDGLALLDNWGMVHILFHRSPELLARAGGWAVAPGRSMAGLAPAPIFEPLWAEAPGAVVGLLGRARSRAVRRWAIRRIEADPGPHRAALAVEGWVDLLGHDDPEVVGLAAEVLRTAEGLDSLGVDRWLALAESANPAAMERVCELIGRHVGPDRVTEAQAARLAGLRPLPVARLGLSWLKARGVVDGRAILGLVDAECRPLRPEILRWLRGVLAASPGFGPDVVLDFLDSRHDDVRAEGWDWFRSEPRARDDVATWRRLMESPHDDIRLGLAADLESRLAGPDPGRIGRTLGVDDLLRLWAAVLLNVHRGSRAKPGVVRQLLRRLEEAPADAPALLPILGVALRSVRGPERRAGLVAVVRLVEGRAEVGPMVRATFPELQWA